MGFNYVNSETATMFDELNDVVSSSRRRYIYKPVSSELLDIINKKITGSINSLVKLSDENIIFSKEMYKEFYSDNKDIIFMKMDNQKHYNLGIVMFGSFLEGEELPDYIDMYLAKNTKDGVVLYKNLKDTPGFREVYSNGNTFKIQRHLITSGASKDNKGSEMQDTNSYEITTVLRTFFSNAAQENTAENKIVQAVLDGKPDIFSVRGHFQKSDSWFSKMNGLASGHLENNLFVSSQIKDADILKTKTSMGEQYVLKRKMDIKSFESAMAGFKRDSRTNRSTFFSRFNKAFNEAVEKMEKNKKEALEEIAKGEVKNPFTLNYFKDQLEKISIDEFKNNLNVTEGLKKLLEILKEKNKKHINVNLIKNILRNKEDYLSKGKFIENELRKILTERTEAKKKEYGDKRFFKEPDFNDYNFDIKTVEEVIAKVDKKYKKIEDSLVKQMHDRIKAKVDSAVDPFYYHRLIDKTDGKDIETKEKLMRYIKEDIARTFFDSYHEKYDLFEIMKLNRQTTKISELDIVSEMVKFNYDKNGKVTDVNIRESYNTELNSLSNKDRELRYGYYKARNSIGTKVFDKMKLSDRLKAAQNYIDEHQSLVKKHKEESYLGKYDTLEDFIRSRELLSDRAKFEANAGDILSRTGDKIISNINYHNNNLEVTGSMRIGDDYFKLKFDFGKNDGFNKNDWIKELESEKQAAFKEIDLETQKFLQDISPKYQKNYILQRLLTEAQQGLVKQEDYDTLEWDKLQSFKSFLKGGKAKNEHFGYYKTKNENGEVVKVFTPVDLAPNGVDITPIKSYNQIYDNITYYLRSNYHDKVGYLINKAMRDKDNHEDMESITNLMSKVLGDPNKLKKLNNYTFMSFLNRDQIINTTGSGKQTSLAHGDSYLTSMGFTLPGMAFNKVTQRTFQSQDLLGERSLVINGTNVSLSELNAEILKYTGVTGVGLRRVKYTTEEMLKESINRLNTNYELNNSPYIRGETYKTFAIGDVNTATGDGLNSFTASFQEGMTATRGMQLTTNAIRNKEYRINLDEIDLDEKDLESLFHNSPDASKKSLHNVLKTDDGLDLVLQKILQPELYNTIKGREKFRNIMEQMMDPSRIQHLQKGSVKGIVEYYNSVYKLLEKEDIKINKLSLKTEETMKNRMRATSAIQNIMLNLNKYTGATVEPTTRKGKAVITTDFVKTHNELKPEIGFSISDVRYNEQTKNIEIMFENIASSAQGSKGQASGAKFTVSEIYDFMKVQTKEGKEIYIDAAFNNKGEKRTQTGMMIHGLLQTVFTNAYEAKKVEGIKALKNNMEELLGDLGVDVIIDEANGRYEIDESYLTKRYRGKKLSDGVYDFSNKKQLTAEEFEQLLHEPLDNTSKIFTERGKQILDRVSKKYGASYYDADGNLINRAQAHTGVMRAIHEAYTNTFKEFGSSVDYIPLTTHEAKLIGYQGSKEHVFGTGNLYLFKLASERVNSNASKKKESALKVSREMVEMLRTSGYNKLSNYIQQKNTMKLSEYMGGLYSSMTNSDLLNTIYDNHKEIKMIGINKAISDNLENGVLFDLSQMTKDDYLINNKDRYLKQSSFIEKSVLGQAIKTKGLDDVHDGKLAHELNIVINDDIISDFTTTIKNAINRTEKFVNSFSVDTNFIGETKRGFSKYDIEQIQKSINSIRSIKDVRYMSYRESEELNNTLSKAIQSLENTKLGSNEDIRDMAITTKMLKMYRSNFKNKNDFALNQLQTIFKTGNVLVTVGLNYDVSEIDGSIIPNEEFNKVSSIAKKYFELKNIDASSKNLIDKVSNKDTTIIDDIYNDLVGYYSGKKVFEEVKTSYELVTSLKPNSKLESLFDDMKDIANKNILLDKEVEAFNEKLAEEYNKLGLDSDELKERAEEWDKRVTDAHNKLEVEKKLSLEKIQNKDNSKNIKESLNKVIFGKERLFDDKTFNSFFRDKTKEQFNIGFSLLEDYVKVPDSAKSIFQKEGKLTSMQKYKINSSFTSNPLEGSNLLIKFENLMFQNEKGKQVTNADEVTKNLKELEDFLGSAVVNENLFNDLDGKNTLQNLRDNPSNFKEGLAKAREAFNRNIAEISEITITSADFTKAFRSKDYNPRDLFENTGIKEKGFIREMAFLSRHPQQTYNHMGGVMNITINTNHKKLNKFAYAALTYLPNEKNQAGIITLGKKTMLYRRGD